MVAQLCLASAHSPAWKAPSSLMGSPQSPTLPNPGKMLKCLPPVGPPALSKSHLQNWGSSNVPGPTITPVPALPRDTSTLALQNGSKASGPLDALLCTPDLSVLCLQHKSTPYHFPALPCPLQAIPRTAAVTPSAGLRTHNLPQRRTDALCTRILQSLPTQPPDTGTLPSQGLCIGCSLCLERLSLAGHPGLCSGGGAGADPLLGIVAPPTSLHHCP